MKKRQYLHGGGSGICSVPDCDVVVRAKFFCTKHLRRFNLYGSPYITKNNPPGKGCVNFYGYRVIGINGKNTLEHRYVAERNIGRRLDRSEDVHHINGNKLDNRWSNLLVLSKGEHTKLHLAKEGAHFLGRHHTLEAKQRISATKRRQAAA